MRRFALTHPTTAAGYPISRRPPRVMPPACYPRAAWRPGRSGYLPPILRSRSGITHGGEGVNPPLAAHEPRLSPPRVVPTPPGSGLLPCRVSAGERLAETLSARRAATKEKLPPTDTPPHAQKNNATSTPKKVCYTVTLRKRDFFCTLLCANIKPYRRYPPDTSFH